MNIAHPTPIGTVLISAEQARLVALDFERQRPATSDSREDLALLDETRRQLDGYFAGSLTGFSLPLGANGTAFQRSVWQALVALPFGTTTSYGAVARGLGRPTAARAIGAANGRNPIAIVVPCHRVIGASGALTGYAGGMERKAWLLGHEAKVAAKARPVARATSLTP